MGTLHLLFNAVTVIFIAAIMFTAGLGATVAALRGVLTDVPLLTLSLIANMVAIPLLGWGIGVLFGLPTTSFIALVLVASSPGGPFGAKPAMVQKATSSQPGAVQVLLAAIGSLTFAPTVNGILTAAKVGKGISLDVGALVQTVALLQARSVRHRPAAAPLRGTQRTSAAPHRGRGLECDLLDRAGGHAGRQPA